MFNTKISLTFLNIKAKHTLSLCLLLLSLSNLWAQRTDLPGGKIRLEAIGNDSTKLMAESHQASLVLDRSTNQLNFNVPLESFFVNDPTNDSIFFNGYKGQILAFKGAMAYDSFKLLAKSNEDFAQTCNGQLTLNGITHDFQLQFHTYKLSNNMDGDGMKMSFEISISTSEYGLAKQDFPKLKTLKFNLQEGTLNLIN